MNVRDTSVTLVKIIFHTSSYSLSNKGYFPFAAMYSTNMYKNVFWTLNPFSNHHFIFFASVAFYFIKNSSQLNWGMPKPQNPFDSVSHQSFSMEYSFLHSFFFKCLEKLVKSRTILYLIRLEFAVWSYGWNTEHSKLLNGTFCVKRDELAIAAINLLLFSEAQITTIRRA